MRSDDKNIRGTTRALCTRAISQFSASSPVVGVLAMNLCNKEKDRIKTHGSHAKNFKDLSHDGISGYNINHALSLHCHHSADNKVPKGCHNTDTWSNVGAERLACVVAVKYFKYFLPMIQNCYPNYPSLQVIQENFLQWWSYLRTLSQKDIASKK